MEFFDFIKQNSYTLLIVAFLLLLFKNRILSKIYGIQSLSVEEAYALFRKPAESLFLDIRAPWELDHDSRIKTSIAIPLSELSQRMDEVKARAKDRNIILVCRSGSRTTRAGIKLKKAGFAQVYQMKGGINAWQRSDYPVITPKRKIKRTYG